MKESFITEKAWATVFRTSKKLSLSWLHRKHEAAINVAKDYPNRYIVPITITYKSLDLKQK